MTIAIGSILPVGTIIHSMLSVAQFSTQYGDNWVLADGRSITGTLYASVTGATNIPDMRGKALRGKDHGVGSNPDGDTALGTYQADEFYSHIHAIDKSGGTGGSAPDFDFNMVAASLFSGGTGYTNASGGNETRMKNITVNIFIRIN